MPTLDPGSVLLGKYRIERILGQGGMGVVAAAHHIQLDQRVALKLMLMPGLGGAQSIERFLREARAAARITSDHVARVYDVGALESGEPYIAMEYLEGQDLSQLLETHGRVPHEYAIDYLLQACEALAEAHARGIVHRDLKPANLYLVRRVDGREFVKVLDFGISKMSNSASQDPAFATRTSALMGSPLYMSPEQMSSAKAVDARSDIWALGVVLYEMLAGAPPFQGETLPQVCAMVMMEEPRPLSQIATDLPPLLYHVVARCLEKLPAARFQSIAELANALAPLAPARALESIQRISHILGVTSSPSFAPPVPTSNEVAAITHPKPATLATWAETRAPAARGRSALLMSIAVIAVALSAFGLWWMRGSSFAVSAPSTSSEIHPAAAPAPVSVPLPPSATSSPEPALIASSAASSNGAATLPPPAPTFAGVRAPARSERITPRPAKSAAKPAAESAPAVVKSTTVPTPAQSPAPSPTVTSRSRL